MIVAVDLGGTRVKAAFADPGGARGLLVAPHGSGRLDGALEVVGRLLDRLEPAPGTAVGMCVPGLVDESGTVVALPGKLAGAVGADLVGWLRDRTGGPAVVVNDAIAYGVGAAGDRPGRTVVMTLGTGVGTAVVEDGRPLGRGAFGGGQLGGQLPLTGDGPRDTSGRAGTIEGWCRAAQLLEQVRAAGAVVADVEQACAAADAGDPAAGRGLAAYRERLAQAVAALCLAYTPRTVVIGGGPATADGPVLRGLAALVQPLLWPGLTVDVQVSEHGDAAALVGLARMLERT